MELSKTKLHHNNVCGINLHFSGPGVPYMISIAPVNSAGRGGANIDTYFTRELGEKHNPVVQTANLI